MNARRPPILLHRQAGISLVITLLMLLALTLLGIAALNNNNLQARMTNNAAESNFGFQNSDNAVVFAEKWLESQSKRPVVAESCTSPCAAANAVWLPSTLGDIFAFDWANNGRLYDNDYAEGGTAGVTNAKRSVDAKNTAAGGATNKAFLPPRYVIEELGQDQGYGLGTGIGVNNAPVYYRITGYSTGSLEASKTLTQSIYLKNY